MKTVNFFVDCHVFDGNLQGTTTYLKGLYQELINDKTKIFHIVYLVLFIQIRKQKILKRIFPSSFLFFL